MNNDLEKLLTWLAEKHSAEWCNEYGEPGYSQPEKGVILCNWNNVPRSLADHLERVGFQCEWSDEWTIDYNHNKAYRTQPSSYDWEPSAIYTDDGELLTPDDSPSEIIDYLAMTYHQCGKNKPHRVGCVPSWITQADLEAEGYVRHPDASEPDFESGWFAGQTDDPASIAQALFSQGNVDRIVFRKTEQSQFYCKFECWVLRELEEEAA